jgi:hypothetical protein
MEGRRGPWYLITGVLVGLALGLIYAWLLNPVEYIDTSPQSLGDEVKSRYRILVALAYQENGDVGRAQARLALLHDNDSQGVLEAQAQQVVANNGSPQEAGALAGLAGDLANRTPEKNSTRTPSKTRQPGTEASSESQSPLTTLDPAFAVRTPTPKPTMTPTPVITFTPRVSVALQPTLGAPFAYKEKHEVCDPALPNNLLQVEAVDGSGQPVAGVQIDVTWNGGEDFFFTGLYPQVSAGYADFAMTPGVDYSVRAGEGGETVNRLSPPSCKNDEGTPYTGGWFVTFSQP